MNRFLDIHPIVQRNSFNHVCFRVYQEIYLQCFHEQYFDKEYNIETDTRVNLNYNMIKPQKSVKCIGFFTSECIHPMFTKHVVRTRQFNF